MNLSRIPIRFFLRCTLLLLMGNATEAIVAEPGTGHIERFVIIPEAQAYTESFEMVMICPAHAHGTPDEAFTKLKNILGQRSPGQISSIWVCRANQLNTLAQFAPLADRVVVNPYVHTSNKKPAADDLIWPTFDHPVVNELRELRASAANKQLVACIDLRGEPSLFTKRQASFKEIQWMVHAAIGADFQGLVWRGDVNSVPWVSRLKQLEGNLRGYANGLGPAQPVGWVTASGKDPVAALLSNKTLFVVLLNPDYLTLTTNEKMIQLPSEPSLRTGYVTLKLPVELYVLSGETLSGKPLSLHRDERQISVDYCFKGGSEILVFDLSDWSSTTEVGTVPEFGDYEDFKKKVLVPYEVEYLKIAVAHQQDGALQEFRKQLKLINEVATRLIRILQSFKDSSLDSILSDIKMNPADTTPPENHASVTSALDILSDYQDLIVYQPSLPTATKQEQRILGEYYRALLRCAQDYIIEQTRLLTIVHGSGSERILPLSIVVQLLHTPDPKWSENHITSLPNWMQRFEYLRILEEFSLHARRPLTAYQFALYQKKLHGKANDKFDYLYTAAARMIDSRDYHAGISCLRAGMAAASNGSEYEVLMDFRLELAKVLESIGHLQLASDEVKQAMAEFPKSSQYGKAAAQRLKYLYEVGQFSEILQEAPKYQTDNRCQAYLPQILYTNWVAHRREKQLEAADSLQKTFLSRFPDHPLAVHMHFASAMDALVASDYDEAVRLLKIIEQLHPDSKIMSKVKDIKNRLEKLPTTSTSK